MSLNRGLRVVKRPASTVGGRGRTVSTASGQALVESALVLPILVVLMLGMLQVGLALLTDIRLLHAAQQAAVASEDCEQAEAIATRIYDRELDHFLCNQTPEVLEVTLTDGAPIIGPWGEWKITESGRAIVRE